jgi:hypothetical protein
MIRKPSLQGRGRKDVRLLLVVVESRRWWSDQIHEQCANAGGNKSMVKQDIYLRWVGSPGLLD